VLDIGSVIGQRGERQTQKSHAVKAWLFALK
jgi:hypothetical protein